MRDAAKRDDWQSRGMASTVAESGRPDVDLRRQRLVCGEANARVLIRQSTG